LNLLLGIHCKKKIVRKAVMVEKSVAADIDVKIDALRKPKLDIAFWEIHRAVINAHMLGFQLDSGNRFQ
jgi:hypothetical protein